MMGKLLSPQPKPSPASFSIPGTSIAEKGGCRKMEASGTALAEMQEVWSRGQRRASVAWGKHGTWGNLGSIPMPPRSHICYWIYSASPKSFSVRAGLP